MPLRATFAASTAIVLAGLALASPARADEVAKVTPYKVCVDLRDCPASGTEGTITWGPQGMIRGVAYDRGPGSTVVTFRIQGIGFPPPTPPIEVVEGRRLYMIPARNATSVFVKVCKQRPSAPATCVTKLIRAV